MPNWRLFGFTHKKFSLSFSMSKSFSPHASQCHVHVHVHSLYIATISINKHDSYHSLKINILMLITISIVEWHRLVQTIVILRGLAVELTEMLRAQTKHINRP